MRKASSRFDVVTTKPSAPTRIRNAPSDATMLMAWSAKNVLQEKTRRGVVGTGGTAGVAGRGGRTGGRTALSSTFNGAAATGTTGGCIAATSARGGATAGAA